MAEDQREDLQHRKAEIMRLRRQGTTFEAIGEQLGITRQRVHQIYTDVLKEIPAEDVAIYRAEQAERLDEMLRAAYEVLGRKHLTISGGKVVRIGEPALDEETGEPTIDDGAGEPVYDDGPTLAAIKTILLIEERRAKLLGLDTPVKQLIGSDVTVTYNFEGIDLENLQ